MSCIGYLADGLLSTFWVSSDLLGIVRQSGPSSPTSGEETEQAPPSRRFTWVRFKERNPDGRFKQERPSRHGMTRGNGGQASHSEENCDKVSTLFIDEATQKLYIGDPPLETIVKLFASAIFNPVHMLGAMLWNTVKIIVDVASYVFTSISLLYTTFKERDWTCHPLTEILSGLGDMALNIKNDIWNIIRSPYYALGIELALIKGVFEGIFIDNQKAIEAKVIVAEIEYQWNHEISYKEDFRHFADHGDISRVRTFYLDWCFQSRGDITQFEETVSTGEKRFEILYSGGIEGAFPHLNQARGFSEPVLV